MRAASQRSSLTRRRFLAQAVATTAGAGFAPTAARAADAPWKIGYGTPSDHPLSVRIVEACAKIRKETNGEFPIGTFGDSILGSTPAMFGQLRVGALEMLAISGAAILPVPLAAIEQLAYAFPNRPAVFAAMDGELGAQVRNAFPSQGFIALDRVWDSGFRHFTSNARPIHTPDDLQGMKLRVVAAKLTTDTFQSLGASTVGLAQAEVYSALQTRVVDGQEGPLALIEAGRYFEIQKYLSLSHHSWNGYWICVSAAKWNSVPKRLQDVVQKHFNAGALLQRRDIEIAERSLSDLLHRQGLAVNDVDPSRFKAKLSASGYYSRWRETFGPAAWTALEKYGGRVG